MNLDKLSTHAEWTKQKLDLIQQHHAEWQLFFALEDETWRSLNRTHFRQRNSLEAGPFDVKIRKQLIRQQVEDIRHWRRTMASYQQALRVNHDVDRLDLDDKKRALLTYF